MIVLQLVLLGAFPKDVAARQGGNLPAGSVHAWQERYKQVSQQDRPYVTFKIHFYAYGNDVQGLRAPFDAVRAPEPLEEFFREYVAMGRRSAEALVDTRVPSYVLPTSWAAHQYLARRREWRDKIHDSSGRWSQVLMNLLGLHERYRSTEHLQARQNEIDDQFLTILRDNVNCSDPRLRPDPAFLAAWDRYRRP